MVQTAPDWICEILSPGTARQDRALKLPIYAASEVKHAWLIDPDLRTLEAFENLDGRWLLLGIFEGGNPVSIAPFDAITFSRSVLWAD